MVRRTIPIIVGIGLLCLLTACSGSKVRILEEQVTQMQTENASLQTEVQSLQSELDKQREENQELKQTVQSREETIAFQEENLKELQLQNLELKANLEETPAKKKAVVKTASISGDVQKDYDEARRLYEQRWYPQAAAIFKTLAETNRTDKLADNAQYWLAECYYAQKQYENALAEFEKVFAYENTNKADDAQLKIGLCWLQMAKYAEAREQLIRLLSNYPDSEYIPRARSILDEIP